MLDIGKAEFLSLENRMKFDFWKIAMNIKRYVSFFGVYTVSDKLQICDQELSVLNQKLKFTCNVFLKHQNKINSML